MNPWFFFLSATAMSAQPPTVVRALGPMISVSGNDARIISQDEAYSIPHGNDVLWLYGDTFYGSRKPDGSADIQGAVSNSSAWTSKQVIDGGVFPAASADSDGIPLPALAYDSSEDSQSQRLWPGHGVSLGDRIYFYYSLLQKQRKPDSEDFQHAGQGLAVFEGPRKTAVRLRNAGHLAFWNAAEPRFGVAVLKGGDDHIYVYGRYEEPPNELILARVKPEDIEKRGAYEYACPRGIRATWSKRLRDACSLFEEAPPEGSVAFHPFIGQYFMLYSRFLNQDVVARVADRPWGPWSEPIVLHACEIGRDPPQGISCYAGKEHPQFARQGGKILYFTLVDGRVFGGTPRLFELTLND